MVFVDLRAEALDVDFHEVRLRVHVVAPHVLVDLHAAENAAGAAHQVLQQLELARAQLNGNTGAGHFALQQVDGEVFHAQEVAGIAGFATCDSAQARGELFDEVRLRHVIIRAEIQALDLLRQRGARGEQDDGDVVPLLTQAAQDAQAIATRHHDVEHERVIRHAGGHFPGLIAIRDGVYLDALLLEALFGEREEFGLIFEQQDAHSGRFKVRGSKFNHDFRAVK